MCGDIYCPSCGPAQGNGKCDNCGRWTYDGGCVNPEACAKANAETEAALAKVYAEMDAWVES